MSCPQGNTNQTFLDTAENVGVAWILSVGTALLCFQGTGRYLTQTQKVWIRAGIRTGENPDWVWAGIQNGEKPRLD